MRMRQQWMSLSLLAIGTDVFIRPDAAATSVPAHRNPITGVSHVARPDASRGTAGTSTPAVCATVAAFAAQVAEEARVAFNVTGLSVGVVCNHSVAFAGGFGLANKEAGYQADEHSLYQIASNTKAFTATVALQLEEQKLLDLDAPIRQANPAFRMIDPAGSEMLTPRDLLSHRTGLPGHDRITFRSKSRQALMDAVAYLAMDKPVRYQPGEYNNMMLAAAGVVEEVVTGRTWEDLVTDRIIIPLNMTSTFANWSSVTAAAAGRLAVPYRQGRPAVRDNVDVAAPCGAMVSSVSDFLKWQQLHLRQAARVCIAGDAMGAHRTHRPFNQVIPVCQENMSAHVSDGVFLLSDTQWSKLLTPNTVFPDLSYFGTYTLGLWWEQYASHFVLHHAGDLEGMASKQAMLPLLGHSVVVLSNENESPARFVIMLQILDHLLGLEPPVPSWQDRYLKHLRDMDVESIAADDARRAKVASVPMDGRKPHWPLHYYVSSYAHPAYGNATVSLSDGSATTEVALQVCGCATLWSPGGSKPWLPACASLFHLGYEKFAIGVRDLSELTASTHTIEFGSSPGSNGAISYFAADLESAVDPIIFKSKSYVSKAWPQ